MSATPLPTLIGPALGFLDLAGIAVFAISGALLAAERRQTLVTFAFFAVVTGIGGGTVRDLLIGAPVFWVHENATLLICLAAAIAAWMLPAGLWKGRALLWCDAVGLGRMALAYPELPADVLAGRPLDRKRFCRTFSDCTTAPRLGLFSGCYPLDPFYRARPEREELEAAKRK